MQPFATLVTTEKERDDVLRALRSSARSTELINHIQPPLFVGVDGDGICFHALVKDVVRSVPSRFVAKTMYFYLTPSEVIEKYGKPSDDDGWVPELGGKVAVRDHDTQEWQIAYFVGLNPKCDDHRYITVSYAGNPAGWRHCRPITTHTITSSTGATKTVDQATHDEIFK